jgi:hypothetical protein
MISNSPISDNPIQGNVNITSNKNINFRDNQRKKSKKDKSHSIAEQTFDKEIVKTVRGVRTVTGFPGKLVKLQELPSEKRKATEADIQEVSKQLQPTQVVKRLEKPPKPPIDKPEKISIDLQRILKSIQKDAFKENFTQLNEIKHRINDCKKTDLEKKNLEKQLEKAVDLLAKKSLRAHGKTIKKFAKKPELKGARYVQFSIGRGEYAKWLIQKAIKDKNVQERVVDSVVIDPAKLKEREQLEQQLYKNIQDTNSLIFNHIKYRKLGRDDKETIFLKDLEYLQAITNIFALCNDYLAENIYSDELQKQTGLDIEQNVTYPMIERRKEVIEILKNLEKLDMKKLHDYENLDKHFKIDYNKELDRDYIAER